MKENGNPRFPANGAGIFLLSPGHFSICDFTAKYATLAPPTRAGENARKSLKFRALCGLFGSIFRVSSRLTDSKKAL
jgi:hypothetical protein